MEKNFCVATDSNADLPPGFAQQHDVLEMQLTYTMDGNTYTCNDPTFSRKAFYDLMRQGKMPITAQINVADAKIGLRPLLEAGQDVLCVMFSSGLSGSYNSVRIAAEELQAQFPQRKIIVIDSLCASGGLGLMVEQAVIYRDRGMNLEQAAALVQDDCNHIVHLVTVNDLFHLHRGGRVSAATAVMGSMLQIKPVLHVNEEGKLLASSKARGRRASLMALVQGMEKHIDKAKCDRFAICHTDCVEDAQFVADEISRKLNIKQYTVSYIGPTVGAHTGPGTVALFFYGKNR